MMRRCDGNESEVGVGVGQEPAVEVGVGTASPRLRNSDRGPEGSGVGDRVALSHGNESGVGVGFGATTTLRPCFLPYTRLTHRMLLPICILPPAANEATSKYASGDEASRRIFRTSAQFAFRLPLRRNEQRFVLPKSLVEVVGELFVCTRKQET